MEKAMAVIQAAAKKAVKKSTPKAADDAAPTPEITSVDSGTVSVIEGASLQIIKGIGFSTLTKTGNFSDVKAYIDSGPIDLDVEQPKPGNANDVTFPVTVTVTEVPSGTKLPRKCSVTLIGPSSALTLAAGITIVYQA
jgi:hypothetical protein